MFSMSSIVDYVNNDILNIKNDFSINIIYKKTVSNENLINFRTTTKSCMLCCEHFCTQQLLDDHMIVNADNHKELTKYIMCDFQYFNLNMCINPVDESMFKITIHNHYKKKAYIEKILLLHPTNKFIKLTDDKELVDTINFNIDRQLMNSIIEKYKIYIFFNMDMCEVFQIKLTGIIPTFIKHSKNHLNDRLSCKRNLFLYKLPKYNPQTLMIDLTNFNFEKNCKKLTMSHRVLLDRLENFRFKNIKLNEVNYVETLINFTELEDCAMAKKMYDYDKFGQKLTIEGSYVKLMIENLTNHNPRLMVGSRLWIQTMALYNNEIHKKFLNDFNEDDVDYDKYMDIGTKFYGSINSIEHDYILIKFDNLKNVSNTICNRYRVHFLNNRLSLQIQHHALQFAGVHQISNLFFPTKRENMIQIKNNPEIKWLNKNILNNPEQQTAVRNMIAGTCYPAPYILFGPPGTGKTSTLVEAIIQIILHKKDSHLLICAPTNSACNEITNRLLDYIQSKLIIRVFAQSINEDDINDSIFNVSNIVYGSHIYPAIESLNKFPIVITTLAVAGRFVQARIDSTYFTHVIIDECGYATEAEALIPIAGLITSFRKLEGNIILSGDPKQLGPVLASSYAEKLGFGVSMLERLMDTQLYRKRDKTLKYDNRYITKLIRNYRSNQHILAVSNKLFYNNELIACGNEKLINWSLKWKMLPNLKIPIIFHASIGNTETDDNHPSFFNINEINIVRDYLKLLVNKTINGRLIQQKDIGVISPYSKQCKKINAICEKSGWNEIDIGSVEKFQGREKSIIIITLVRSGSRTIGFLNNPKRMNVALTRAQGLLIIIGDIETLQMDKNWRFLIQYCKANNLVCYKNAKLLTNKFKFMSIN